MIAGRSASASSLAASSTPSAGSTARAGLLGRVGLALHEDDVERVVDEGRAQRGLHRAVERLGGGARDVGRLLDGLGVLHQRADERQVVDLLERAHPPPHLGRAAAERHHRHAVGLRGGDRADAVGHAGAGGEGADARLAGRLGPADRGEGGGLLVAEVDDVDPLGLAAVVDREEVAAAEGEELADAAALQRLGDQPAAVDRRPRRRPGVPPPPEPSPQSPRREPSGALRRRRRANR